VTVPQRIGDQLTREYGVRVPTVLKTDVEGGEVAVLDGLKHRLE
jgi:FkbM family methyltransferase